MTTWYIFNDENDRRQIEHMMLVGNNSLYGAGHFANSPLSSSGNFICIVKKNALFIKVYDLEGIFHNGVKQGHGAKFLVQENDRLCFGKNYDVSSHVDFSTQNKRRESYCPSNLIIEHNMD